MRIKRCDLNDCREKGNEWDRVQRGNTCLHCNTVTDTAHIASQRTQRLEFLDLGAPPAEWFKNSASVGHVSHESSRRCGQSCMNICLF